MILEQHVALLVCDQEFHHLCESAENYVKELLSFIKKKEEGKDVVFKTVSGRYSFLNGFPEIHVDGKNKTTFVRSISGYLEKIDEAVIISNYRDDGFLVALKNELAEEGIPTTLFSYQVATSGQHET